MKIVNKGYLLVEPKPAFIEWANKNDEDYSDLSSNEANIYLVEEDVYNDEQLLKSKYKMIFTNELLAITENKSVYPEINMDNFREFFEITFGSCVFDTLG